MKFCLALFYALSLLSLPVMAENVRYNRVDLSSEAESEVANDLMTASLSSEYNDPSPSILAGQINITLNMALKEASTFSGVKASSGNQTTNPVYGKNNRKIEEWRGHAEIRLESRDFKAMGELIARLEEQMQLHDIQFAPSVDTRQQVENTLITKAIDAFRKRASTISTAMGGKGYKIVHISINHGGGYPSPRPMMAPLAMSEAVIPAPQFAGGESTMSVQVSGTIEVTP